MLLMMVPISLKPQRKKLFRLGRIQQMRKSLKLILCYTHHDYLSLQLMSQIQEICVQCVVKDLNWHVPQTEIAVVARKNVAMINVARDKYVGRIPKSLTEMVHQQRRINESKNKYIYTYGLFRVGVSIYQQYIPLLNNCKIIIY